MDRQKCQWESIFGSWFIPFSEPPFYRLLIMKVDYLKEGCMLCGKWLTRDMHLLSSAVKHPGLSLALTSTYYGCILLFVETARWFWGVCELCFEIKQDIALYLYVYKFTKVSNTMTNKGRWGNSWGWPAHSKSFHLPWRAVGGHWRGRGFSMPRVPEYPEAVSCYIPYSQDLQSASCPKTRAFTFFTAYQQPHFFTCFSPNISEMVLTW